jgi:uncharacterized protein (TIGR02001 family)
VQRLLCVIICLALATFCAVADAWADESERWNAPFGGAFSANFTVASDYSYAGISQTQLGPAVQMGLDYRTPTFSAELPVWFYLTAWGSTINFPTTGPGVEVDLSGGFKFRAFDRKLSVDLGYLRYLYPGIPASYAYEYGDISLNVSYDFGFASLAARVRFSPNSFGNSGQSWNKRALLSVPLPFLKMGENISFKTYGSLGNIWVDRFTDYGLPSNDYWYWQIGLVTSAYGVDITVAYTDTSIEPAGCLNTAYCSGRVFARASPGLLDGAEPRPFDSVREPPQLRVKPSSSLAAQSSVFSIASPRVAYHHLRLQRWT